MHGSRFNETRQNASTSVAGVLLAGLLVLAMSGCSIKKMAINQLGDALAASGSTFSSDDDPELVRAAIPFSLKLMESLLAESPEHEGLLLATCSYFTQFSYAFVQQDADIVEDQDFAAAEELRGRARRLYRRAFDYGMRGLETRHEGFREELEANAEEAVSVMRKEDVPFLYWTAVAWASTISLSKDDPFLIARVPQMEAMMDRALELDENWDMGAIHAFLITYEMSRQGVTDDPVARARHHFERAMELSRGRLAGPLVAYAESVCVQQQDVKEFDALLKRALALDPDEYPEHRLVNLIMQERARWLRSQQSELFLLDEPAELQQ